MATLTVSASCGAGAVSAQTTTAPASRPAPPTGASLADVIAEASQRFGVPSAWIGAVMRMESGLNPRALSPRGAMGLMQLMPETWAAMQARFGLGRNPYDPHDNVVAGVGYLRMLYDQFGAPGFLAAYNAGSERYLDYLIRGRALPPETRRYVAELALSVGVQAHALGLYGTANPPRPAPVREALFAPVVGLADAATTGASSSGRAPSAALEPARPTDGALFPGAWTTVAP